MTIKKATGYVTSDGKMFASLDEAALHIYGARLRAVLLNKQGGSGVFGVGAILNQSREVSAILQDYNAELDRLDRAFEALPDDENHD